MTKRGWGEDENGGGRKGTCSILVMMRNVPFAARAEYSGEKYSGG